MESSACPLIETRPSLKMSEIKFQLFIHNDFIPVHALHKFILTVIFCTRQQRHVIFHRILLNYKYYLQISQPFKPEYYINKNMLHLYL